MYRIVVVHMGTVDLMSRVPIRDRWREGCALAGLQFWERIWLFGNVCFVGHWRCYGPRVLSYRDTCVWEVGAGSGAWCPIVGWEAKEWPKRGSWELAFFTTIKRPVSHCLPRDTFAISSPFVGNMLPSYCRRITEDGWMGVILSIRLCVLNGIVENSAPVSTSKSTLLPFTSSFTTSFLYDSWNLLCESLRKHLRHH